MRFTNAPVSQPAPDDAINARGHTLAIGEMAGVPAIIELGKVAVQVGFRHMVEAAGDPALDDGKEALRRVDVDEAAETGYSSLLWLTL